MTSVFTSSLEYFSSVHICKRDFLLRFAHIAEILDLMEKHKTLMLVTLL